ncbi:1313_t:CDS:2, partial [Racocetra persica]
VFAAVNIGGISTSSEYRPVRFYAMKVSKNQNKALREKIELCIAKASVLERFSSLVSVYYIIVGIIAGVSRVLGTVSCQDWLYIPILLSWTISALCRRAFSRNLVVKDPKKIFRSSNNDIDIESEKNVVKIILEVTDLEAKGIRDKRAIITLTAFLSIIWPWLALILAYLTPLVGYF